MGIRYRVKRNTKLAFVAFLFSLGSSATMADELCGEGAKFQQSPSPSGFNGCAPTAETWKKADEYIGNAAEDGVKASAFGSLSQEEMNDLQERLDASKEKCNIYAKKAVGSNTMNLKWECGYEGNEWNADYNAHFHWCVFPFRPDEGIKGETDRRFALIQECGRTQ